MALVGAPSPAAAGIARRAIVSPSTIASLLCCRSTVLLAFSTVSAARFGPRPDSEFSVARPVQSTREAIEGRQDLVSHAAEICRASSRSCHLSAGVGGADLAAVTTAAVRTSKLDPESSPPDDKVSVGDDSLGSGNCTGMDAD